MLTDDGVFSRIFALLIDPLTLRYLVSAAIGALLYAGFDWWQGTGGKAWGRNINNTKNRG